MDRKCLGFCAALCVSVFISGCTESPFGNSKIAPPRDTIRGKVTLDDAFDHEGIYVWLSGVNIATYTDSAGIFRLQLPASLGGDGFNGVFNLYFFVANYSLQSTSIVIQNGEFVYGRGDVDKTGFVSAKQPLKKFLEISTIVLPRWSHGLSSETINVATTLRSLGEPVTVVYPNAVGGLMGGVVFRNRVSNAVYMEIPFPTPGLELTDTITQQPKTRRFTFTTRSLEFPLPVGNYEVIPYMYIANLDLPKGLLESLGVSANNPAPQVRRIPFRRSGGNFRVID